MRICPGEYVNNVVEDKGGKFIGFPILEHLNKDGKDICKIKNPMVNTIGRIQTHNRTRFLEIPGPI